MAEVHERIAGAHQAGRRMRWLIHRYGFYWPNKKIATSIWYSWFLLHIDTQSGSKIVLAPFTNHNLQKLKNLGNFSLLFAALPLLNCNNE